MRISFSNPFVFSGTIIILIFSFVFIYTYVDNVSPTHQSVISKSKFQENSYNGNNQELGTYDFPNINVDLQPETHSLFSEKNNYLILFLIIYSLALSMLFTYRERSRTIDERLNEKIQIDKAQKQQSKINIYNNIENELMKYKDILSPEFNIEHLDEKIDKEVNYILFNSRIVLEKIFLSICLSKNIEEGTLGEMMYTLYKKRILNPQTNGYAHTIKAFGNRAAHPNIKKPIKFNSKDALLVLSVLVTLLNELHSQRLLQGFES